MPTVFEGNWPAVVNKDAKYSVRSEGGKYVVGIEYRTADGEKWYPTSDAHEELVGMVNDVKMSVNDAPGGVFYINEYRQVVVPAGRPVVYYLAGSYQTDLVFDFEGHKISGMPLKLDGNSLRPGDPWEGPHQGVPYKLKAGGRDISFEKEIRPNVTKEFVLSSFVGTDEARRITAKVSAVIGFQGGRFYINEFRQLFTGMPYRYIGALERDDPWFPMPHSSR